MKANLHMRKNPQCPHVRAVVSLCIFLFSSFILHPASFAQAAPKVEASAAPSEIKPGSSTTYTITIEDGQPDEAPQLQLPAGLAPAGNAPSFSNQTSIINGVVKRSSTLAWMITARQAGTHVIPPQEIHIGGKPYKTNEVRIVASANAAQPSSQNDPIIVMQIEKREIYVGEVVPITVTLYAPESSIAMQRIGLIELPRDNFAIQRFPIQAEQTVVSMGGSRYRAFTFRSTLSALKPGKFKLGPATSEVVFEVEARGNADPFQHPFFRRMEQRTAKPQSSDIDMNVLPLPDKDRPAGFKGLVGDFDVVVHAEPQDLSVGDPISVELNISGTGNFDSLTAPELTKAGDWKTYPARRLNIRQPDLANDQAEQRAAFNQVIIPKKSLSEIPPFEFVFFSPTRKQYITARTQPVPIRVKETSSPSATKAPGPAVATAGEQSPADPDSVSQPQVKLTDIVTMLPEQAAWATPHPVLWKNRTFLFWNGAAATAVILLLGFKFGASLWQSRILSASSPANELRKQLRGGNLTRGAFYQTAAQYIRLRGGAPNAECQSVIHQHEQLNFRPSQPAAEAPVPTDERARVLKILQA